MDTKMKPTNEKADINKSDKHSDKDDSQENNENHIILKEGEDLEYYVDQLIECDLSDEFCDHFNGIDELSYYFDYNDKINDDQTDSKSENPPNCTVYIGNLPTSKGYNGEPQSYVDEYFIQNSFLKDSIILDREDTIELKIKTTLFGLPYSYANVKFLNKEEAIQSIEKWNFAKIEGNTIHMIISDKETRDALKNEKCCVLMQHLDPEIDESQLFDLFSNYGEVIYCQIKPEHYQAKDSLTRAYIYYRNPEDAKKAVIDLEGKCINGNNIYIRRLFDYQDQTYKKCFIKNLPKYFKDEDLENLFSEFGEIVSCRVIFDENKNSKKYGICIMKTHEEAVKAVEGLNNRKIDNFSICCSNTLSVDEIRIKLSEYKSNDLLNYVEKMNAIQNIILDFIEEKEALYPNELDRYQLDDHEFKSFLSLILKISNNHLRSPFFFNKFFQILQHCKDRIKLIFSNNDLLNFFISNKRILLFLIQEKLLIIDKSNVKKLIRNDFPDGFYSKYFYPEIKNFINDIDHPLDEDLENFEEKRKLGENSSYICQLIRNDDRNSFISFIEKNSISLNSQIPESIFETNLFLIKNKPNLIEYSAFFGAINIFKYFCSKKELLTPSLWLYGIHGKNPEIIHLLEDNCIHFPNNSDVYICLKESIKCHHNEIVNYILNMLNPKCQNIIEYAFHYDNYEFFSNDFNNFCIFKYACKYDHFLIVKFLLPIEKFFIYLKMINTLFF